jgi:Uma2 family endonuclease
MGALKLKKYTYSDYVTWDGEWELIDGVPYAMAPAPIPKHQIVAFRVANELEKNLECENCEVFIAPIDWKIDEFNIVQPDVSIFCEDWENKKYLTSTPPLIVEVLSLSTAIKDANLKYKLYERVGVRWYVLINPENKEVKIFKNENGYKEIKFDKSFEFEWNGCKTKIDFERVFNGFK